MINRTSLFIVVVFILTIKIKFQPNLAFLITYTQLIQGPLFLASSLIQG